MIKTNEINYQETLKTFGDALERLHEILLRPAESDEIILDATIQRFEFVVELCWKTLKKFLWREGLEANTPKEILRKAYAAKWISDEKLWLKMLEDRNLTSHTYKEALALEIYQHIKSYYPELKKAYDFLTKHKANKY